jgi:hypothetical protein
MMRSLFGRSRFGGSYRRAHAALGLVIALAISLTGMSASSAIASTPAPALTVISVAGPTNFAPGSSRTDIYSVRVTNTGGAPTDGSPITITDNLPPGLTLDPVGGGNTEFYGEDDFGNSSQCSAGPPITCTLSTALPPDTSEFMFVPVDIAPGASATVTNHVSVSGGGAPDASTAETTPISSALAGFGFQDASSEILNADGSADTQAGSHPYEIRTSFDLNTQSDNSGEIRVPSGGVKDVTANLPAGLVVNPGATPVKCTEVQLESEFTGGGCPAASQVGLVRLSIGPSGAHTSSGGGLTALFNMVAPAGTPADLAFDAANFGLYVHLAGSVRTGADYGLTAKAHDITQFGLVLSTEVVLWGNPSDSSHERTRTPCTTPRYYGQSCPIPPTNIPFVTLPSACSGPLTTTISADSWFEPANPVSTSLQTQDPNGGEVGVTGCSRLAFNPSISVQPDTTVADSPSGLNVDLHVPQDGLANLGGLAEANLKTAVVTLPAGTSVSPSAADGLGGCSQAQIGLDNASEPTCPDASKIGSVEVDTPLLSDPLKGAVYLAQQGNLPGNGSNPFGSLLAIYVTAEADGALIKLAGHVVADPVTGQLTATFDNNPQLPFSDFKLNFFGGPRAALATPEACGTYTTTSSLTPWSGTPAAAPSDTFAVTTGCGGGFAPSFSAGTTNNQAGGFSPFSVTFARPDGQQRLGSVQLHTPPGLLGVLKSVAQCPEPQASQGACGPESQIGHTTVGAGAGPDPFYVGGNVFLTGPYKGAPFGLSIVVHAVAGPFDLGNVIVRAAISIDPHTAQITVTSDPLPTILQGIPLDLRTVNVTIDRSGFMFNPTSCSPLSVAGTIASTNGVSAGVSSPFEAANCANLPFKPSFAASTQGHTSKANGASLTVKIAQKPREANIHTVNLQLPISLPSRLTTLQKACTEAQFNANPAGCPEGSFVGTATAHTPVLNAPLTGPAILVSHGGADFPDVEFVLQGEGVEIVLDGKTDIKKGRTYSNFETVPDAPISSFETVLPEGPHSILGAYVAGSNHYKLCGQSLTLPTTITAQNGAVITQTTKLGVTGCPKAKTRAQKLAAAMKVCHKKAKGKRAGCEKQARRKYGPLKKTTKK